VTLRAPVSELEFVHAARAANIPMPRLDELERDCILSALEASNWVVGGANGAAARLRMKRTSLAYKIQKFAISRPQPLALHDK
jgi:formate hydrogenlyase transcriptional activator